MASRIDRLKALTGNQEVYVAPAETQEPPVGYKVRAQNIYEGSDSEEDLTARMKAGLNKTQYRTSAPLLLPELGSNEFPEYKLEYGELAPEGEAFCLWKTVTGYPYSYIGNANRSMVAENFFHHGRCYNQTWDFFYLYRLQEDNNQSPILLVPTKQLEYFLTVINQSLGASLTIPSGAKGAFKTVFNNDGTPYPRYLGRALNQRMADGLREVIPPRHYKLDGEPPVVKPIVDTSLAAFKAKIEAMNMAQKAKKKHNKQKQKIERVAKQQSWRSSTKRVQRYLGLRKRKDGDLTAGDAKSEGKELNWDDYAATLQQSLIQRGPNTFYDPEKPAKFTQEDAVVFISIDVEAYELNNNAITEIGIATLDVLDLVDMAPGPLAANWREAIRARHFRIKEHIHLNNSIHVTGCADKFGFGTSEIIPLASAPQTIGSCFRPPYSGPSSSSSTTSPPPVRNIVLVGHDIEADVRFLRQIGYDITNLALHETIDTTLMWRALKREPNPRALGHILADLDIVGWNLHNAGNDAVYTLQAMLGIACRSLVEKKEAVQGKGERERRVAEAVREATENALEREEGWSSDGSDGGERITAEAAAQKKTKVVAAKPGNKRTRELDALWNNPAPSSSSSKGNAWEGEGLVQGMGELGLGSESGTATGTGTGASVGGGRKEGTNKNNSKSKGWANWSKDGNNGWGEPGNARPWTDTNGW
ncbi:hypothetical protein ACMFMG_010868 [Clarireedia jacksonii]